MSAEAKAYDNKLWRKWDNDSKVQPEDRDWMHNFYYSRRHLAAASDPGGMRDLKYKIELDKMDTVTCGGLERIYKRDGAEIGDEVALDLLMEVLKSICSRQLTETMAQHAERTNCRISKKGSPERCLGAAACSAR
jgi:hypothetical protein